MSAPKIVLIVVWLFCAVGLFSGAESGILYWGKITFGLMAVAHVGEFLVFRNVFEKAGGSMGSHFGQTLVFGFLHIQEAKEAAGAAQA